MKKPLNLFLKKKVSALLFHPLTLSLFVTLIILLIFPVNIPKYRLTVEESERNANRQCIAWDDLENDGTSDKVIFLNYQIGYVAVGVYFHPSGRVKEWNIPGTLVSQFNNDYFLVGEISNHESKEIFVFTQNHDSLFLNRISDLVGQESLYKSTFLSALRSIEGRNDVNIVSPRLDDMDGDGSNELIFGINTGFSITPRAVFVYNFRKDTLFRSAETGNSLLDFLVADVTGDHRKEIITMGYAPQNLVDTVVEFHDSSNWAMVFNGELKLLFPPAEFKGRTGGTSALTIPGRHSRQKLFILWSPPASARHGTQVYQVNASGESRFVREFTELRTARPADRRFILKTDQDYKLVFPMKNGEIYLFDTTFGQYSMKNLQQEVTYLQPMDIDLDGEPEILVFDFVAYTLTICRDDFTHPAMVNIGFGGLTQTTLSIKQEPDLAPLICMSSGELYYLLSYQMNPYWPARWVIRAAIWLFVFLFTLLIRKTTRMQLEKRIKTEKKITELQLKIVRNQMDPHFTMNAINSVVDAINREEKEQARDNLLHFSQMYRSLVLSADKIKRTLQEEIDFTENYLALEKFRFGNRFSYTVAVDPWVDRTVEVPKMVIQSPVENAVKHGLLNKESGGEIVIHVGQEDHGLVLEITDNGIGRAASSFSGTTSTGKGMEMMEQFFGLYHKITGIRVQSTVTDLQDENGTPAGTRVVVSIPEL